MKCSLLIPTAALFFSPAIVAQKAPATAPVTTSPGRTTSPNFPSTTSPNPNTNPNTNTNPMNTTNNTGVIMNRPIYLSGKVIMEDGTPPPDLVRIEKICGGNPRPEGYTDSKGRFSFQLDSGMDVMADASDANFGRGNSVPGMAASNTAGSSVRRANLNGCELRASLPGFRSTSVSLAFHDSLDNPNVGAIVLHRMGNVDGTTISMTTLNAPKEAQKNYQKGREALKKQKSEDAEKSFRKAVEEYPKFAAAWYELGHVEAMANRTAEAQKSFEQSIAADPKLITPYVELSRILAKDKDWKRTAETTEHAIKLNPVDFPQLYFFNAVANFNLQNVDAAEKSALEAQKLDTRHEIAQMGRLIEAIEAAKKTVAKQ